MSSEREILEPLDKIKIVYNRNLKMSPGKLAAQCVHAALNAYGIKHGSVNVLEGSLAKVKAMDTVVVDAGWTEVKPGSVTCGATIVEETDSRAYHLTD